MAKSKQKLTSKRSKYATIKHSESLSDLIQLGDVEEQTLSEAQLTRLQEIIEETDVVIV